MNVDAVPSVAELPTCQKTLQGLAPLIRSTRLADAVIKVEPAWKTKADCGLPRAFNVRVPVRCTDEAEL
jgi:hypothetical protein